MALPIERCRSAVVVRRDVRREAPRPPLRASFDAAFRRRLGLGPDPPRADERLDILLLSVPSVPPR